MDNHISPQNPSWQNGFESHTSTPTHQKEKSFQETLNEALSDKNLDDSELAKLLSMKDKFKKEQINLFGEEYQELSEEIKRKLEALKRELSQDMNLINLDGVVILIDKGKYNKEYIGFFLENVSINNQNANQIKDIILKMLSQGFEANTSNKSFLLSIEKQLNNVFLSLNTPLNDLTKLNGEVVLNSGKFIEKFPSVSNISTTQENTGNQSSTKQSNTEAKISDDLPPEGTQVDPAQYEGPIKPSTTDKYSQKETAKIENNSSIAGTYTVNIKDGVLNKRDIHGNDIGNVNKGETLKINGYQITLGGITFYQAEGTDKKLFYVAADYLKKQKNESAEIDKKTSVQEYGTTETDFPESQPYAPTITIDENGNEIKNSETDVERPLGKFSEINGNTLNQAIDKGEAKVGDITLKYLKNSDRIRFTLGDVSFTLRVSELSEKQGRKTVYLIQENLQTKFEEKYNTALSEQNTEKAETELSKIQEQVEKISMVASEFFVEPIQSHEQAWIDTLSGNEVTLNNISVTKDHNNNTIITFDIDDSGINDEINSNFVINLETSNFDELLFKAQLVKSVQKRIIPKKSS